LELKIWPMKCEIFKLDYLFILLLFAGFFLFGCGDKEVVEVSGSTGDYEVFSLLDSTETGVTFVNQLHERKDWNILFFDYFYNGGGVAAGDISGNGFPDLFFTGNTAGNKLFLNKGDMKFEDVTSPSGIKNRRWSTGVLMVDINNDGLLDIYVCNGGPYEELDSLKNELYINQGDGTFIEAAEEYGIAGQHRTTHASFFDYNQNGLLDLFVMNYSDLVFRVHDEAKIRTNYPNEEYPLNSSVLYRNNGDGTFTDVTEEAGLMIPAFGLGLITSDMTGNGLIDIYISNDYLIPNYLFVNQGDGTFVDEINDRLGHSSHFSMGVDYADLNNDGLLDIAEVDMMPEDHVLNKTYMRPMNAEMFFKVLDMGYLPQFMFNCLHLQHGFGIYSDIAHMAGVGKTDWSWAALLADVTNDGWKDYFVSNGFRRNLKNNDYIMEDFPQVVEWMAREQYDSAFAFLQEYPGYPLVNYMYQNNGNLTFSNKAEEWGLGTPTFSNGAIFVDLDLDGDLDLIINNVDQPAFIYRNNTSEKTDHQWIQFEFTDDLQNQWPLNTRVYIKLADGQLLTEEFRPSRGFQGTGDGIVHLGLGSSPEIVEIKILWPDGKRTFLNDLELNKRHKIDINKVDREPNTERNLPKYHFRHVSDRLFSESFMHKEDDYHDFDTEVLLPYRHSRLGPFLGVGDVNGNGFEDFFIGGAKGQSGKLYLLDPARGYYPGPCQPWENQSGSEDMGSVFFDANGNGLLDLYIVSGGGGEFNPGNELLRDRLYLNTGEGCFEGPVPNAIPDIRSSGGRVIAGDFDGDGIADLFVAGRTYPGVYPFPAESVLLRNKGGVFEDVTDQWAPELRNIGMVTDAVFHDFTNNGELDLLICGEWMTLKLFIQENGKFIDRTEEWGLGEHTGWWYSINLIDVNQNGRMDIVAGNLGLNNKWGISKDKPLHVFANDFDDNGTIDIVLSSKYRGNLVPLRGRECSSEQMPFIQKKFPTYSAFANATLEEVYGREKLEESLHYTANEARSMVWVNEGQSFKPIPLPNLAQIGPVMTSLIMDVNEDGIPDIIIGGGLADTEPETTALDSNRGLILVGNGDGTFAPLLLQESGIYFTSLNVRDLAAVTAGNYGGQVILTAGNNSHLQALHFLGKH
jgi:enediyne biosynthesis protein E4